MSKSGATTEVVQEAQYKTVATLLISGVAPSAIAKQLNVTRYHINKILKQDDFRTFLKEQADNMVSTAANTWKAAMQDRIAQSLTVIDDHLKKGNLEAVKIVIKSIGIDNHEPVQQSSSLTVVLPDLKQPKDIEV